MHEAETAASYRCKTTAKNDGLSRAKDAKWTGFHTGYEDITEF